MAEVNRRPIPKVPALRGKTVVQPVLRGLDPHPAQLRDRGQAAVGRHDDLHASARRASTRARACATRSRPSPRWASTPSSSATSRAVCRGRSASWTDASVINAGDGWHAAPDAGAARLLHDPHRAQPARPGSTGCGSRSSATSSTAASPAATSQAFAMLGADVTLVAPRTLLPPSLDGWPVDVAAPRRDHRRARRALPAAHAARADERGAGADPARVHGALRADAASGRARLRRARARDAPGSDEPRRRDGGRSVASCPAR